VPSSQNSVPSKKMMRSTLTFLSVFFPLLSLAVPPGLNVPAITAVSPEILPLSQGRTVTLSGDHLAPIDSVECSFALIARLPEGLCVEIFINE
jgi:hypothetical protein